MSIKVQPAKTSIKKHDMKRGFERPTATATATAGNENTVTLTD
jgi:hypothetical protein